MEYFRTNEANKNTVKLKGVGMVYGTLVNDLKVGDTIISDYEEVSIVEKIINKSPSYLYVIVTINGKKVNKKLLRKRIIGRPYHELPKIIREREDYPKIFVNYEQFYDCFRVFSELKEHLKLKYYKYTFLKLFKKYQGLELNHQDEAIAFLKKNRSKLLKT